MRACRVLCSDIRQVLRSAVATSSQVKKRCSDSILVPWPRPKHALLDPIRLVKLHQCGVHYRHVSVRVRGHETSSRLYTKDGHLEFQLEADIPTVVVSKSFVQCEKESTGTSSIWIAPTTSAVQAVEFANEHGIEVADAVRKLANRSKASAAVLSVDLEVLGLGRAHPVTQEPLHLRPFQLAGIAYAVDTKRCFIADDMGLGKTVQALAAVQHLGKYPLLIVCPKSVKTHWRDEVQLWLPDKAVHVSDGNSSIEFSKEKSQVVITNYDYLVGHVNKFAQGGFQALVVDESHYVKSRHAKRTKAVLAVAKKIPSKGLILALTGTPILGRPYELIAQLSILKRIKDFGGMRKFQERYCDPKRSRRHGHLIWDYSGASNIEELHELLRQTCYLRREKTAVLQQLPSKTRSVSWVDICPQKRVEYERRLAQLLRNNSVETMFVMKRLVGEGKLNAARDWIDSFLAGSCRKLVVFAWHRSVVDALTLQYGGLRVAGVDSEEKRHRCIKLFQNDPCYRVLVLNMTAGGVGITLTSASDVLFVEQGWSSAQHLQAEDRCHRIGQRENVSVCYLLARDTIDEELYELIERKRRVVDPIVSGGDAIRNNLLADIVDGLLTVPSQCTATDQQVDAHFPPALSMLNEKADGNCDKAIDVGKRSAMGASTSKRKTATRGKRSAMGAVEAIDVGKRSAMGASTSKSSAVSIRDEPMEKHCADQFSRKAVENTCGTRSELPMVHTFRETLCEQGHRLGTRCYYDSQSEGKLIGRCDLYDYTTRTLYEAKSNANTNSIRTGIGQLLHYQFLEKAGGNDRSLQLSLLLPASDVNSLGNLDSRFLDSLADYGISVATSPGISEAPGNVKHLKPSNDRSSRIARILAKLSS